MDDQITESLSQILGRDGETAWRGFTVGFLTKSAGTDGSRT